MTAPRVASWFVACAALFPLAESAAPATPPAERWSAWQPLVGEWVGVGEGTPGQAAGSFSFTHALDGHALVRRSRSVIAASDPARAAVHEDMLIAYHEPDGSLKATYYDNEGHVVRYLADALADGATWRFRSEGGAPGFRLTYTLDSAGILRVTFEISPSGEDRAFKVYLSGSSRRVRSRSSPR